MMRRAVIVNCFYIEAEIRKSLFFRIVEFFTSKSVKVRTQRVSDRVWTISECILNCMQEIINRSMLTWFARAGDWMSTLNSIKFYNSQMKCLLCFILFWHIGTGEKAVEKYSQRRLVQREENKIISRVSHTNTIACREGWRDHRNFIAHFCVGIGQRIPS